jgi:hypothetical protein
MLRQGSAQVDSTLRPFGEAQGRQAQGSPQVDATPATSSAPAKPEIVQFEIDHVWRVKNRGGESAEELARGVALLRDCPHMFFSGRVASRIIGLAGIVFLGARAGFPMALFSDEIGAHKLWFHKTVKRYFAAIVRSFELETLAVEIAAESERNRRWIQALGFKLEGPLADYRDSMGRDYLMYRYEVNECRF